jgi:restriction endonuclease S subunit
MTKFVSISEVAEVNPAVSRELSALLERTVTFLPMAAVSESAKIIAPEERLLGEVVKGYRYFEQGDVLLAKITPCMENGKAAFVENIPHQIGFGSTEFHVLRPSLGIDGRYLFYMVWNPVFRHIAGKNMTGTAGQKRVPTDFVKRYKIPLPPIEEQRRIADILNRADAIRRKRQEAIRMTEELLRSAFLETFGDPTSNSKDWQLRRLGELVEIVSGQVDPRQEPYLDMPHIGGENIESHTGRLAGIKTPRELNLQSGKYLFQATDILYSKIRPYLNKVVIPGFSGVCSADIYPLRLNNGSDNFRQR